MQFPDQAPAARWWTRAASKLVRLIAPWRAAEARAAMAEARLRAVLEAIPEGVVILDAEGRYKIWNQAYADIYHRSADLFVVGGKLIDALREGVARGDYPDAVGCEEEWLAIREEQLTRAQARHEQRISDGRWLLVEDRRLPDGGLLGLRVDVTEMKQQAFDLAAAAEAAEAANRAKSEFLANVSHEIRTPLHGILGMVQVLDRDEALSEAQRSRLGLIRQSGKSLLELLNDLLDLAKIEAGKLDIQETEFRPASIAEAVCATFEPLADEKGLKLETEFSALDGAVWLGDPLRLQQVIANLVSNAIKFTARGEVSVRAVFTGKAEVEFRVTDSGIGIPPDRLAEVFEKFSQVESAKDRRFGGTGLGLALSRQLAELMGGTLSAQSTPGAGSVFRLRIPVKRARGAGAGAKSAAAVPQETPGVRILAAEDNATNQLILRALLEPMGVDVTVVGDGQQAVEAFRTGVFDLILMDIQMPVADGLSATQQIRRMETEEGRTRTPIVALSANVMAHQTAEYRACGMDAVVGKPFEVEALWGAIVGLTAGAEAACDAPLRADG
jgi:signal transduction histidine kinase/CheY-like chemotaxis protein